MKKIKIFIYLITSLILFFFLFFLGKSAGSKALLENSRLPACLFITQKNKRQDEKIQKDIISQIEKINKEMEGQFFKLHPNCNPLEDTYVSIIFVDKFDEQYNCNNPRAFGCVRRFRDKKKDKILYQDIIILEPYMLETIRHELAHIAGCEHGDYVKPCWM